MIRLCTAAFAASLLLVACASVPADRAPPGAMPPPSGAAATSPTLVPTRVLDRAALARLIANRGVTLQWIDWNTRGSANVRWQGDMLLLTAAQARSGGGRLFLDGVVEELGSDYFTFRGTIRIDDTPDAGRRCEANKSWHFAVTQGRPYWRLREFEWCDGLTDYVDIYF